MTTPQEIINRVAQAHPGASAGCALVLDTDRAGNLRYVMWTTPLCPANQHTLLVAETSEERLSAHWQGFIQNATLKPISFSGGEKSISDDDLCATCRHCQYQPGEMSRCTKEWPGRESADGYVQQCNDFSMTNEAKASLLAEEFSRVLREWLTDEQMAAVLERNKAQSDPLICHSHDFCDANMAMDLAARNLGLKEIYDRGESEAEVEQACSLWNEAWAKAKASDFAADC